MQTFYLRRRNITDQYTETDNVLSSLSEVWRLWVPRGKVLLADKARPFLLNLVHVEDITPGGTDSQVLETTYKVARVLDPSGGHLDGDFQGVYLKADGTKRTITAVADHVDGGTPSITISDATAAAHRVCYVPKHAGRVVIKIEKPMGMGSAAYPILDNNTNKLHAMNQHRFLKLSAPCPIPEDYAIVVYLDAAWASKFVSGASAGSVNLDFAQIQIPVIEKELWEFPPTLKQEVDAILAGSPR